MEQQAIIFEARKKQLDTQQDAFTDTQAAHISKSISLGLVAACVIIVSFLFFSLTSAKKASAIEPTPNEHSDTLAQTFIASQSALSESQQPIETLQPTPTPTESFPSPSPIPVEQKLPSNQPTPTPHPQVVHATSLISLQQPLASYRTVSTYFSSYHPGVDLTDPTGTPVMAAANGVVIHAGWSSDGYGNSVVIDHQNGMKTRYAHLSIILVSLSQTVSAGQVIGAVGCTGHCTGSHLHFEVIVGGIAQNPFAYLSH